MSVCILLIVASATALPADLELQNALDKARLRLAAATAEVQNAEAAIKAAALNSGAQNANFAEAKAGTAGFQQSAAEALPGETQLTVGPLSEVASLNGSSCGPAIAGRSAAHLYQPPLACQAFNVSQQCEKHYTRKVNI